MNRRAFLVTPLGALGMAAPQTKMTIQLSSGSIGVRADQRQAIEYAHRFGFQSVEADSGYLKNLPPDELRKLVDDLKAKGLVWGNAGLPVQFRTTDEEFRNGMADLPARAKALQQVGVTRVSTWISPTHDSLTFTRNMEIHARRLRETATVLADHGHRLGLEYVGPKTSWTARKYPFVHSMAEMKDLIAAIGKPNVGFVLDSWHWYTAKDTVADLESLTNKDVVSIDLNDAPAGLEVDQQVDSARELPCATGVIPVRDFLNALQKIGCDAPARCEPFNAALRKMPPEQALEATIASMKKAFSLIG